jgi:hypothetical protein
VNVLLDECIPRKFKASLGVHDCTTVPEAGLAGQVFLAMDKGLQYQQNLAGRRISVVVTGAVSNRLSDLLPFAEACNEAIRGL